MIKGIGTDLVEKRRIKNALSKFGDKFIERVLTEKEKEEYRSKASLHKKISFISNNFACKEATSKALGTGFTKGVSLKNIEVLREDNGSPYLNLLGAAKKRADKNGYEFFKLSISDTKDHSLAVVIGEGK